MRSRPGFNKTILIESDRCAEPLSVLIANRGAVSSNGAKACRTTHNPIPPRRLPGVTSQATKTLTNSDLAAIRQRRLESEQAYEAAA